MICPPILKSPNPSRASLVRHSLYKLNRIGDNQHPLPILMLLVSPRFIRTLTLWAIYKLLINLLPCQSIPVPFRICINLVQLTWSNTFCQSMKQTQLLIYLQGSFWYSRHPNCIPSSFSSSKSKLIFSEYILNFLFNPSSKYLCYIQTHTHTYVHITYKRMASSFVWRQMKCRNISETYSEFCHVHLLHSMQMLTYDGVSFQWPGCKSTFLEVLPSTIIHYYYFSL